jgi:polar amino acid transport system substrate-binding protein
VKWLLALGIVLACLACDSPGAATDTLAAIRKKGELVWAADIQGGEPYVSEDPAHPGQLVGFEVDIAAELARRLGVKARFQQYAWSNIVPGLLRGDFDIGLNGLEATQERAERLRLSTPYFVYGEILAVRNGSKLATLDDLVGQRVGTLNQSYAMELLRGKGIEPHYYEGVEEPYLDLQQGRLDAVLLDDLIASRYGCPLAGLTCRPEPLALGTYVVAIRPSDARLAHAIDDAISGMRADGTLRDILDKHGLWNQRQTGPMPAVGGRPAGARGLDGEQLRLFLQGAGTTLLLSVLAFLIAVPLGIALALGRLHGPRPLRVVSTIYVEVFRGTPVLLQLYLLYFAVGGLGALSAAVLGLGLNYAAYESEVYRGALSSVARGQHEAAHALGLSGWQTLWHVIGPQALRVALPPMTNDFIALLKDSSIVGVISVVELTKRMSIAAVDLRGWLWPGLLCASMYFVMSFPLSRLAARLEKKLAT